MNILRLLFSSRRESSWSAEEGRKLSTDGVACPKTVDFILSLNGKKVLFHLPSVLLAIHVPLSMPV